MFEDTGSLLKSTCIKNSRDIELSGAFLVSFDLLLQDLLLI